MQCNVLRAFQRLSTTYVDFFLKNRVKTLF